MNPSSSTLHISNLKSSACENEIIKDLFSPFGKIEAINFLTKGSKKCMCLIRF